MTTPSGGALGASTDADLIRAELAALGLSQREAARKLEVDERAMRYYCAGREPVPAAVKLALAQLRTAAGPRGIQTILEPEVVARVVPQVRSRYGPLFVVAEDLHRLAAEILPQLEPARTDNTRLLAAALFGRILTSFQSIYVLAERGLTGDARTLIRTLAESTIFLGALAQDSKAVTDQLIARNIINERKLLRAWLEDPQAVAEMSPEHLHTFKVRLAENTTKYAHIKRDPVDIQQLARWSGLLWLYNTAFRMHSGDAAHISVLSLERHVKANDAAEIIGLQFGPNAAEVPDTLSNAIPPLLNATHTAISLFDLMHYKPRLDQLLAAWQALPDTSGKQHAPIEAHG